MEDNLVQSGLAAFIEENYKTAIDQFSKSLQKNSDNYEALLFRGCTFLKTGDYSKAIDDFTQAEKLNGESYELLLNRTKAYFLNMDCASAQADLEKTKKLCNLTEEQKNEVQLLEEGFSN